MPSASRRPRAHPAWRRTAPRGVHAPARAADPCRARRGGGRGLARRSRRPPSHPPAARGHPFVPYRSTSAKIASESTVMSGSCRSMWWPEELLVVRNDPVVDPDDAPVPDRVVVGCDGRVALRVVAHVNERLGGSSTGRRSSRASRSPRSAACGRSVPRLPARRTRLRRRLARRFRQAAPESRVSGRSATRCRRYSLRFRTCELPLSVVR